jgi:hypothetical protein
VEPDGAFRPGAGAHSGARHRQHVLTRACFVLSRLRFRPRARGLRSMAESTAAGTIRGQPGVPRIAPPLKRDWTATPPAFARLLEWLDEGHDSGRLRKCRGRRRCRLRWSAATESRRRPGSARG